MVQRKDEWLSLNDKLSYHKKQFENCTILIGYEYYAFKALKKTEFSLC